MCVIWKRSLIMLTQSMQLLSFIVYVVPHRYKWMTLGVHFSYFDQSTMDVSVASHIVKLSWWSSCQLPSQCLLTLTFDSLQTFHHNHRGWSGQYRWRVANYYWHHPYYCDKLPHCGRPLNNNSNISICWVLPSTAQSSSSMPATSIIVHVKHLTIWCHAHRANVIFF